MDILFCLRHVRSPRYLAKMDYEQVNMDTLLTVLGNRQHPNQNWNKVLREDRDVVYDWYKAYFCAEYTFQPPANGANVATNTESAPVNSSSH